MRVDSKAMLALLGPMKRKTCILSRSWRPGSVIIAGA
jgi:hypothetical protein